MTGNREIPDASARRRALDPVSSFIVQAPAGSGKTELLVQRFLALLARVDHPEEIVAITFTRKAAAEMRGRILSALTAGRDGQAHTASHERRTRELARAALDRDETREWNLIGHPGRLRVQTVDSLCAALTGQMPLLSGFGSQPRILDEAGGLYREAARETIRLLETDQGWAADVERLLDHLGNDLGALERLLAGMLGRREQWLGHAVRLRRDSAAREGMEAALLRLLRDGVADVAGLAPEGLEEALVPLARFAGGRAAEPALAPLADLERLPGDAPEDLEGWLAIARLLRTGSGGWRRRLSRREGFPAPSEAGIGAAERALRRDMKAAAERLLADLAAEDGFGEALDALDELPPAGYHDDHWATVEALTNVLMLAAAQLRLVFRQHGRIDFTEVAAGALAALGQPDAPTNLTLALDYRIRHVLVDEFQDTSQVQYDLLARLTAGWEPGDGRTLFLVGDPMQSVYRFRQAEVGLYLRTRRNGIGGIALEPLTLSANFRSAPVLVQWLNEAFARLMPPVEDIASGAVPYSRAFPARPDLQGHGVRCHPFDGEEAAAEAARVVRLVEEERAAEPGGSIAVLLRARSHGAAIAAALRTAGQPFRAVDLEPLADRPVIRDLMALTRALLHPADRLAWLSVLRAPWCGLDLADLTRLAGDEHRDRGIPLLLRDPDRLRRLSEAGRRRLLPVRDLLEAALANRRRERLHRFVESVWLALGGPACVESPAELEDATAFFGLLCRLERASELEVPEALEREVNRLYARPDPEAGDAAVQLMTIHKAKGLEFDTVILPGLGRAPASPDQPLMRWMEIPRRRGDGSDLLIAPTRRVGADADPVYRYLARLERRREALETVRLLYVAATRARRSLHLLGHVRTAAGGDGPARPQSGSLLDHLWPAVAGEWKGGAPVPAMDSRADRPLRLRRLPEGWCLPDPPPAVRTPAAAPLAGDEEGTEYRWTGETARRVGAVVHRLLAHVAETGPGRWDRGRLAGYRHRARALLESGGVPAEQLDAAVRQVLDAVAATLEEERGRWLLRGGDDPEARARLPLSGRVHGRLVHATIDRSFVDGDGVRWVVDYKVAVHSGGDREAFLAGEMERYRRHMADCALLVRARESRPVRAALYFPLLGGWRVYPEGFEDPAGG